MHLIGGDVLHLEKRIKDQFPLFREFELMPYKMGLQAIDFFGNFGHR